MLQPNIWYAMQLTIERNGTTSASVNGKKLFWDLQAFGLVPDNGFAAIGTVGWGMHVEFDNVTVKATA
jgi:hypothetical protein